MTPNSYNSYLVSSLSHKICLLKSFTTTGSIIYCYNAQTCNMDTNKRYR